MSRKQKWAGIYFWVSVVAYCQVPTAKSHLPCTTEYFAPNLGIWLHSTLYYSKNAVLVSGLYLITCLPQNILQAPHSGQQLQTVIIYCNACKQGYVYIMAI